MINSSSPKRKRVRTLDRYQLLREGAQIRLEGPFRRELAGLFRRQGDLLVPFVKQLNGIRISAARKTHSGDESGIIVEAMNVLKRTRPTQERIFRTRISRALVGSKKINQGLVTLSAKVDFELFNKRAKEFLDIHLAQLSGRVEDETLRRISRLTSKSIEKGRTVDELAKDIRGLFRNMAVSRSKTIAQTEIGIAQSVGDYTAAKSVDLDLVKIWSNSKDDKVRPSHQIREVRDMNDRFSNGLLFPLEPGAPASEIIRCRCTALYTPRSEAADYLTDAASPPAITDDVGNKAEEHILGKDSESALVDEAVRVKLKKSIVENIAAKIRNDPEYNNWAIKYPDPIKDPAALYPQAQPVEDRVDTLIRKWAGTSGDSDPSAIDFQRLVKKELNLVDSTLDHLPNIPSVSSLDEDTFRRMFVRTVYAETQKQLQKEGVEWLRLYRGTKGGPAVAGKSVELKLQPLSSFSSHRLAAENFILVRKGGQVYETVVHRSQVFCTARTGLGCLNEREVVLLGKKTQARVAVTPGEKK